MYLVTVGRDVRGAAGISAKVNDVIKLVTAEAATFTDPQLAGQQLGALLDAGPRRLLVLDDVWEPEQLAPFAEGGKRCARLVTTRMPELLAGRGVAVPVDQMSPEQARALLTAGLPPLDEKVVQGLLAVTGRWPLLLRLVNKILADYAQMATETDVSGQGALLLGRLRAGGPVVVDDVLGDGGPALDVGQPAERAQAVGATIGASTSLLEGHDAERFAELAVFAENEAIPFRLVARLWRATAGMDDLRAGQVCKRLAQLALVSQADPDQTLTDQNRDEKRDEKYARRHAHGGHQTPNDLPARSISLHAVFRNFLRAELGKQRLAGLNGTLLDAVAADLPAANPLDPDGLCAVRVAWWDLGDDDRYLWDHLIKHLLDAGRPDEAGAIAADLRWVGARLERFGPAAPAADLSAAGTPQAARLRAVLTRTADLLAPTDPARAVVDVLHSRVAADPDWGPQVTALRDLRPRPRLANRWPLPDLPDPALRRVLTGHQGWVEAVAIARDGSWLATARRRRDGADLGRGNRTGTRRPHRPQRPGGGGGDRPRRQLAGHRQLRRDRADLGRGNRTGTRRPHRPQARQRRWRSPPTAAGWPPAAWTGRCGSGTRSAASDEPPSPATTRGERGGDRPRRQLAGHRRQRRDGADLGRGERAAPRHPHRPQIRGAGGGDRPRRQLAGHRQPATGRCGSGTRPPGKPRAALTGHRYRLRWGGGDRPRRQLARHRQLRRDGADLGRDHRAGTRHPHRPRRPGEGGGDRPRRQLASHRRRRRDGADLGRGHRTGTGHPHRPRRPGERGGDRPRRQLAGHRRQRRHGADLGLRPPDRNEPPSPATRAR